MRIDGLQYANWSEKVFRQLRAGRVDAVHVTITYHETFRETVLNIERWNRWFERFPDLIVQAHSTADIDAARAAGRTAIVFGAQNPSCIEDDIGLVEILHRLGLRVMQLTYNNQSLLASGCYEDDDTGLTRMGREVVAEMNRVGLVVDMSHSGERSTLETIAHSVRPIAITHANPSSWHPALRNKSDTVLKALAESGGMLGLSLYPHHLKDGSACTLREFCDMAARTVELMGPEHVGIGSDLCQDQPDSVVDWMRTGRWTKGIDYGEGSAARTVELMGPAHVGIGSDLCQDQPDSVVTWMRTGRWTRGVDYGEGSAAAPGFPPMPDWFEDNRHWDRIEEGLCAAGLSAADTALLMGGNWHRFFAESFGPCS